MDVMTGEVVSEVSSPTSLRPRLPGAGVCGGGRGRGRENTAEARPRPENYSSRRALRRTGLAAGWSSFPWRMGDPCEAGTLALRSRGALGLAAWTFAARAAGSPSLLSPRSPLARFLPREVFLSRVPQNHRGAGVPRLGGGSPGVVEGLLARGRAGERK